MSVYFPIGQKRGAEPGDRVILRYDNGYEEERIVSIGPKQLKFHDGPKWAIWLDGCPGWFRALAGAAGGSGDGKMKDRKMAIYFPVLDFPVRPAHGRTMLEVQRRGTSPRPFPGPGGASMSQRNQEGSAGRTSNSCRLSVAGCQSIAPSTRLSEAGAMFMARQENQAGNRLRTLQEYQTALSVRDRVRRPRRGGGRAAGRLCPAVGAVAADDAGGAAAGVDQAADDHGGDGVGIFRLAAAAGPAVGHAAAGADDRPLLADGQAVSGGPGDRGGAAQEAARGPGARRPGLCPAADPAAAAGAHAVADRRLVAGDARPRPGHGPGLLAPAGAADAGLGALDRDADRRGAGRAPGPGRGTLAAPAPRGGQDGPAAAGLPHAAGAGHRRGAQSLERRRAGADVRPGPLAAVRGLEPVAELVAKAGQALPSGGRRGDAGTRRRGRRRSATRASARRAAPGWASAIRSARRRNWGTAAGTW